MSDIRCTRVCAPDVPVDSINREGVEASVEAGVNVFLKAYGA